MTSNPTPDRRAEISAHLWQIAEQHIVAEWICCEPLEPRHDLCAKGYAALGMVKALLVDCDPEKAWNPAAPVLDAVMQLLAPAVPSVSAVDQTTRDRIAEALDALQGTAHHLPPKTRERVEEVMAGALARVLPSDGHATAKPMGRGVKAEALLLHFTAEAHRRKWDYDRGLDDDGQPIKSEAFDALHRLGDEMNAALHKLRATPAAVLPPPADRAAVLREEAALIRAHCPDHLDSNSADGAWISCHCDVADDMLRRLADEAQQSAVGAWQPDTETPKRASRWGVCDGCGAAAGPDCDCPPDTDTTAVSAVPGRSAATSTDEETQA